MTYVAKGLPTWARFRKAPVKKPVFGPPTFTAWMVEQEMRNGICGLIARISPGSSPLTELMAQRGTVGGIDRGKLGFWR